MLSLACQLGGVGYGASKQAAKRLLRKVLKKQMRPPRVMITDKLGSYGAAKREFMPRIEHRQHKGLNNRAENSRQPTRNRVSAEAPQPLNAVSRSSFFGLAIPPGAPILVRSSNSRSGGH